MSGGPAFQAFCVGGRGTRVRLLFDLLFVVGGLVDGGGGSVT